MLNPDNDSSLKFFLQSQLNDFVPFMLFYKNNLERNGKVKE